MISQFVIRNTESIYKYAIMWIKIKQKDNLLILQGDLDPGLPRLEDRPLQALDGGVSGRMHANHISTTYTYRYFAKISLLSLKNWLLKVVFFTYGF